MFFFGFSPDLLIVITYLLATIFVGISKNKKVEDIRDYAISDRNFSIPILIAAIFATFIGAGATVGLVEKVVENGVIFIFIFLGIPVSKFLIAKFLAPKMTRYFGLISPGDIMEISYGKVGKVITGLANSIISIGDLGIQVIAIGKLFELFLGIPVGIGSIIGSVIVIMYSTFGGIRSVTSTDVLQFIILIISIPIIANLSLIEIGGYEGLFNLLPQSHLNNSAENEHVFFLMFTLFIIKCLPFEMPAMIQRVLMAKDQKQIVKAMYISSFIDIPFILILGIIGLSAVALFPEIDSTYALYEMMNKILPVGIKGFAAAGMMAVIMSTSDSILNNASIAIVHDIFKPFNSKMNLRTELLYARVVNIILGASAIIVALNFSSIFDIWTSFYGVWMATVIIPLICTILGVNISVKGFLLSGAFGLITFFGWNNYVAAEYKVGGLFPSLVASSTTFIFFAIKEKVLRPNFTTIYKKISKLIGEKNKIFVNSFLKKDFRISGIAVLSTNRVKIFGAQYVAFGSFAVFNYLVPYFMWSDSHPDSNLSLIYMRTIGGLLCSLLIIKDYWPARIVKYLPVYWHATLIYCLPFLTIYMFLETELSMVWLINLALACFLLAVLVDWVSFMFILPIGIFFGYTFFSLVGSSSLLLIEDLNMLYIAIYACIFSIGIGLIFSRNKEYVQQQVVELLEIKVEQRTLSLKEALNSKKEFLNNMSHEIRTPLQGIIGISNELVGQWDKFSDKDRYKYATKVSESGDRLLKLVSNLLDLSKFEAGKMILNLEKIKLKNLIEDVIEEAQGLCMGSKISLSYIIDKNVDSYAVFDKYRIAQVIRNLIANAIRYTQEGVVEVHVSKVIFNKKNEYLEFKVKDQGVGIPQEELLSIFKPFYQSSRTKTSAGGTGLGLAICSEIINAHRGNIWAEKNGRKGTIFCFIIPIKISLKKNSVENKKQKNISTKKKLNILLIDDEETCLTSGSLILEGLGHKVTTADGGKIAIKILKESKEKFDIILLDLMMQDMYGLNVLEEIKLDAKFKDIPIILQSGTSDINEINKAISLGAVGHVTKPYVKNKMLAAIYEAID